MTNSAPLERSVNQSRGVASVSDETIEEVRAGATRSALLSRRVAVGNGGTPNVVVSSARLCSTSRPSPLLPERESSRPTCADLRGVYGAARSGGCGLAESSALLRSVQPTHSFGPSHGLAHGQTVLA